MSFLCQFDIGNEKTLRKTTKMKSSMQLQRVKNPFVFSLRKLFLLLPLLQKNLVHQI